MGSGLSLGSSFASFSVLGHLSFCEIAVSTSQLPWGPNVKIRGQCLPHNIFQYALVTDGKAAMMLRLGPLTIVVRFPFSCAVLPLLCVSPEPHDYKTLRPECVLCVKMGVQTKVRSGVA